ncbi:MAG: hypothetical protein EOO78_18575, partial [Oxalobacteraceae bacterium]
RVRHAACDDQADTSKLAQNSKPAPAPSQARRPALVALAAPCIAGATTVATTTPAPAPLRRLLPRPDRLYAALALVALVTGFAVPMFGKTLLYLCTYVLQDATFTGDVLLTLAVSQIAGATLWTALVRRHDKTRLLAASHAVAAIGIALFAAAGAHRPLLHACAALAGIGLAGVFMLPWGILADSIDFAEFRYRERRDTIAFATMLVLLKGGGAAALATVGWTLAALGYVPGIAQSPGVVLGMKSLAFGVPVLGAVAAIAVLLCLDIGHARHARVRRINSERRRRALEAAVPATGQARCFRHG